MSFRSALICHLWKSLQHSISPVLLLISLCCHRIQAICISTLPEAKFCTVEAQYCTLPWSQRAVCRCSPISSAGGKETDHGREACANIFPNLTTVGFHHWLEVPKPSSDTLIQSCRCLYHSHQVLFIKAIFPYHQENE